MRFIEEMLVRHCGAVLLQKKPAAIFSVPRALTQNFSQIVSQIQSDVDTQILFRRENHDLVMVYCRSMLEKTVNDLSIARALGKWGYPIEAGNLEAMIAYLKKRITQSKEFPHEIGFFLGYPPEDVQGFIIHRGRNFKHSGPWKVYGDVEYAKSLFLEHQRCKERLQNHLARGGSLRHAL